MFSTYNLGEFNDRDDGLACFGLGVVAQAGCREGSASGEVRYPFPPMQACTHAGMQEGGIPALHRLTRNTDVS